jgi:putative transposase
MNALAGTGLKPNYKLYVNISERELDICLMKQARRTVQRGGYLQFENLMYRGENLAGYAGENVIIRFDPRDITTVLIY